MQGSEQTAKLRAELYVRSLLPEGLAQQQDDILDRLDALTDDGTMVDHSVHVWGQQAPASRAEARTDAATDVLDRIASFREWADRNGCSLSPAFRVREVDSALTGEQYRALVFPTHLLVESHKGELQCVTPHKDGGTVVTVSDRLDELEAGEPTQFEPLDRSSGVDPPSEIEEETVKIADEDHEPIAPE